MALEETQNENSAVKKGVDEVSKNAEKLLDELGTDAQIARNNAKAYDLTATNLNGETLEDGKSINPGANNMAAALNEQKDKTKKLDQEASDAIDKLYSVSTNAQNTVDAHRDVLKQ